MQKVAFRAWLKSKGLSPGYVSYGEKVEKSASINLDQWYLHYPNHEDARQQAILKGAPNKQSGVIKHYWSFSSASAPLAPGLSFPPLIPKASNAYWDATLVDLNDSLNATIWSLSPSMRCIQNPSMLRNAGSVGAQQAMIEAGTYPSPQYPAGFGRDSVLPWIPDYVGKKWQDENALLVVGSAYAGIIKGYCDRDFPLKDYAAHAANGSAASFQRDYINIVMQNDPAYYDKLAVLCAGVLPPSNPAGRSNSAGRSDDAGQSGVAGQSDSICLFDLCRASFIKLGDWPSSMNRGDKAGDEVVRSHASVYVPFVECFTVQGWLWDRIINTEARRIAALGTIAEHGLIRLFLAMASCKVIQNIVIQTHLGRKFDSSRYAAYSNSNHIQWPQRPYVTQGNVLSGSGPNPMKLGDWLKNGDYWIIRGSVNGQKRKWHLLPVYHPSWVNAHDSGYGKTIALLQKM